MQNDSRPNLHPERRRKRQASEDRMEMETESETETESDLSPFFTLSRSPMTKTDEIQGVDTEGQASKEEALRLKRRQQLLSFNSQGILVNKKPLVNPINRSDERRKALAYVAAETYKLLLGLLATRPDITTQSYLCQRQTLDPSRCPKRPSCTVRVISSDTIDAALALKPHSDSAKPVCILNMANARSPGGGWRHGAMAQEEALCYRTSLSRTLHSKHYPIADDAVIYSPNILVIRDNFANGHDLLDLRTPADLAVLSVISCAAVELPYLKSDPTDPSRKTYRDDKDRKLMKEKMRIVLRTAIRNRHRQLVLGALGCGAFGNPNWEVAKMWKDVLLEKEFSGGYWADVVFAVLDGKGVGNLAVFKNELEGLIIQ